MVQVVVNLLRKDVASQKYIILHDATANPLECHYGKLGWETRMNDLFSEIGIHSKGAHVLLMDTNVVFLKPLFEKSDREKGAWEVWGINEECPKCHFEHLICRKPLYWDDNIFLVHRTSFGPGT